MHDIHDSIYIFYYLTLEIIKLKTAYLNTKINLLELFRVTLEQQVKKKSFYTAVLNFNCK